MSETQAETIKAKNIECESITIKHPDGNGNIQLMATPQGIGIWLNKNDKRKSPMISIYSFNGQTAIGITSTSLHNEARAYELALTVDDKTNEPSIQMIDPDGRIVHLTPKDIAELNKINPAYV